MITSNNTSLFSMAGSNLNPLPAAVHILDIDSKREHYKGRHIKGKYFRHSASVERQLKTNHFRRGNNNIWDSKNNRYGYNFQATTNRIISQTITDMFAYDANYRRNHSSGLKGNKNGKGAIQKHQKEAVSHAQTKRWYRFRLNKKTLSLLKTLMGYADAVPIPYRMTQNHKDNISTALKIYHANHPQQKKPSSAELLAYYTLDQHKAAFRPPKQRKKRAKSQTKAVSSALLTQLGVSLSNYRILVKNGNTDADLKQYKSEGENLTELAELL